jgi:hypothetical protein
VEPQQHQLAVSRFRPFFRQHAEYEYRPRKEFRPIYFRPQLDILVFNDHNPGDINGFIEKYPAVKEIQTVSVIERSPEDAYFYRSFLGDIQSLLLVRRWISIRRYYVLIKLSKYFRRSRWGPCGDDCSRETEDEWKRHWKGDAPTIQAVEAVELREQPESSLGSDIQST